MPTQVAVNTYHFPSPLGILEICADDEGVHSITFQEDMASARKTKKANKPISQCIAELEAYFQGESRTFTFPMVLQGSPFQKKVWTAIKDIPFGSTISYLELSRRLGDVKAIRAVAAANGKNPMPIVLPCHRVIGSDGSLTGYAGGLRRKKWLLDFEAGLHQTSLF